jgi:hypothetical protein
MATAWINERFEKDVREIGGKGGRSREKVRESEKVSGYVGDGT